MLGTKFVLKFSKHKSSPARLLGSFTALGVLSACAAALPSLPPVGAATTQVGVAANVSAQPGTGSSPAPQASTSAVPSASATPTTTPSASPNATPTPSPSATPTPFALPTSQVHIGGGGDGGGGYSPPYVPPFIALTVSDANVLPNAIDVAVTGPYTVTFNKDVDVLTLPSTVQLLGPPLLPMGPPTVVPGTVTYDPLTHTASFSPTALLAPNTAYTLQVTAGAKDSSETPILAPFSRSFTTVVIVPSLLAVDLQSASNFSVLAGTTVTNSLATTVWGDLGLSPGSAVVGFDGVSGHVTGTQFIAGTAAPAPAIAAQAQLDLGVAYGDASGRTTNPVLVAGNLGGLTLRSGLYKSTGSLQISSGTLTLTGDANAVWIFQMATRLDTSPTCSVVLAGGAKAKNVFWQVGSSATLGTTSSFKGNILAAVSITMNTGSTLEGRALAQNGAVALNNCTITQPAL